MFSSVKLSTYRYHKTNKTLSFILPIYHRLYANHFALFSNVFHRHKKNFLITEIKLRHYITLKKIHEGNIIALYNYYC